MGRSTNQQAEENRARIVAVAGALFRQHGVAAVSIADVMTAAGMTQGGFYKHFPSKDALAAEACTSSFGHAVAKWKKEARIAEDGGQNALVRLVTYYFTPKPPAWTCPMVALGQDAAAQAASHPLSIAYRQGASDLFEAFAEVAEGTGRPREEAASLFAAMVGANLLGRAVGKTPWVTQLESVVLGAAFTKKKKTKKKKSGVRRA